MKPDYTRALILAGQLSDQVRRLVVCRDPFCWTPIAVPLKGEVVEVAQ